MLLADVGTCSLLNCQAQGMAWSVLMRSCVGKYLCRWIARFWFFISTASTCNRVLVRLLVVALFSHSLGTSPGKMKKGVGGRGKR